MITMYCIGVKAVDSRHRNRGKGKNQERVRHRQNTIYGSTFTQIVGLR